MAESSAHQPRTWGPIVGAAGLALAVMVGAVVWWIATAGVSDDQRLAVEACEERALEAQLPAIVRGEVTGPAGDGTMSVAWSFEDGTHGGCEVSVVDGIVGEPTLVGDVAPRPSPSAAA